MFLCQDVFVPCIQICAFIKIKGTLSVFLNTLFVQLSIQARSVTEVGMQDLYVWDICM